VRHGGFALFLAGFALLFALPAAAEYQLRSLSGPRADIAALLLTGGESGTLRVSGLAVSPCVRPPVSGQSGPLQSWLGVEIESQSLLDAIASHDESEVPQSIRVELYVYVMTRAGEIVDSRSLWVRLPLTDLVGRLPGGGVLLVEDLDLPAGEYQLRTLVREARSQQFALRILGLTVQKGDLPTPSISPPIFARNAAPWIVADGGQESDWFPSSLPVLAQDSQREFALQGCHLQGSSIGVRLLNQSGQPVSGVGVDIGPIEDSRTGQTITARIAPGTTDPGLYVLEATATSSSGTSTHSLPVFVTDTKGVFTWTALGGLSESLEPTESAPELDAASGSSKKSTRAIETAYEEVLGLLASGRLDDATSTLMRLERRAIEAHDNPRKAVKWISGAQNRVTAKVLKHDPECLLPLLLLHLELQSRYVEERDTSALPVHATRSRIRSLAEVYATDAKQEMAPQLAAAALVELAAVLERSGYLTSALIVLREALALDQSNTDVILDLAYQYEHHRFRSEALALLRRLLELDPHSDEGRLRLAMILYRFEQDSEALTLLHQLVDDATTEWVLAVAYQELAHSMLRRDRFADAARLLEEAVRRLPANPRLRIELSYALDRAGRRRHAREALAGISAGNDGPSPRLYYRVPDRRGNGRSRSDLLRHATARLPLLTGALSTEPPDTGGGSQ
jgi:Flp pilus assembly protein TadD